MMLLIALGITVASLAALLPDEAERVGADGTTITSIHPADLRPVALTEATASRTVPSVRVARARTGSVT